MAQIPDITISIEQSIHAFFREELQRISDKLGIQVDSLAVNWIDVSTKSERRYHVSEVRIDTTSREF